MRSEDKEPYLGSVRFFKHVILAADAALIVIPTVIAICLGIRLYNLSYAYEKLSAEFAGLAESAEDLNEPAEKETGQMEQIPFSVDLDAWNYFLLNDTHPLEQAYEPLLAGTRNGKKVDRRIKSYLEDMLDDAKAEGYELWICSAYRDYEKQQELVDSSVRKKVEAGVDYKEAFFRTKEQIAVTGTSEHHLGLAVDIVGVNHQTLDVESENTEEVQWLLAHAHEYGFILRYPRHKESITGISYEPWHYRYVGKDAATFIKEHELCLEEFIDLAEKQMQKR